MILLENEEAGKGKIVTADRDEHIRVSHWPKGWEIERFLLGQRKFVSALATHPANRDLLLSAGGDDHLRIWSTQTYECISKSISLEPLKGTAEIRVEFEAPSDAKKLRRKAQIAKRKQNKAADSTLTPEMNNGEEVAADHEEEKQEAPEEPAKPKVKVKQLDLAIRKMLFVGSGAEREDEDSLLVLSGVG
jgi:tRNA (guanine-N(7)-)-methyltransferase subunit TRM82